MHGYEMLVCLRVHGHERGDKSELYETKARARYTLLGRSPARYLG
jgi:hypothetical protein